MTCIREKTGKTLIFEMGQSDETSTYWASLLPDMGAQPHDWIADFLRTCGFSKVVKTGETDAYRSGIRRALFLAQP